MFSTRGQPSPAPAEHAAPAPSTQTPHVAHISASQLKTASLCLRKWWFEKQANVRSGGKYHFHFGKVLHGYLERYQLRQPLEPVGWDVGLQVGHAAWVRQRAEESIRQGLVRAVTKNVHIEYQLSALVGDQLVDSRGLPLLGVARARVGADGERRALPPEHFYDPGGLLHTDITIPEEAFDLGYFTGFMDGLDLTPEHPGVFDHKTAKNRTYAKSPAKLLVDEQMLSYAAVLLAMPGFEQQQEVYLRHNVFLKDPEVALEKSVYGVDATVQVDAVAKHWAWVIATAKTMKHQRAVPVGGVGIERAAAYEQVPSALQVMGFDQGKRVACECYGGCPYKRACLGYSSVQTVTAELDYEARSVDQYGNDPRKKQAAAYVEKTFKSLGKKKEPCVVDTIKYDKEPSQETQMPFNVKNTPTKPPTVPPLTVGSYAWVDDPDEVNKAYRCNVRAIHGDGDTREADIYLYVDPNAPTPVTATMAVDLDRITTVPWSALSPVLKAGRGGYGYNVVVTSAVTSGETIPGTPIPTAGPVSINTPDAAAVLAASVAVTEAKVEQSTIEAVADVAVKPKRPGRPAKVKGVAVEPTISSGGDMTSALAALDAAGSTSVLAQLNSGLERAALAGVLEYVAIRLNKISEGVSAAASRVLAARVQAELQTELNDEQQQG